MSPRVSIIIPIYNVEAYLRACLDSVLSQTETNWEALLIDDASTDTSAAIAAGYCCRDHRFRLISLPHNRGLSAARNAGLDVAAGSLIAFLDSDDALHPQFLSVLSLAIDGGADIAMARLSDSPLTDAAVNPATAEVLEHPIALCLYQRRGVNPSACGKLFRRKLFHGLRFREEILYEDLQIMPALWERAGQVAKVSADLYYYRSRPGSIINTFNRRRLHVLAVTEEIERRYAADPVLGPAAAVRRFAANFNMFMLLNANGLGHSADADGCWQQMRRLSRSVLTNPRVRLKDRLGALAAMLLNRQTVSLICRR